MKRLRTWAVPALIGLSACVAGENAATARPDPGNPAPDFQAESLAGDTVSLADLQGSPVLLNLWATWCVPCRQETPFLESVYERYSAAGLEVVGVSQDSRGARKDVDDFVAEFGVKYRILHDPAMVAMDIFQVIGLPATYLIGPDGTIRWKQLGPVSESDRSFEQALQDLVGETQG